MQCLVNFSLFPPLLACCGCAISTREEFEHCLFLYGTHDLQQSETVGL